MCVCVCAHACVCVCVCVCVLLAMLGGNSGFICLANMTITVFVLMYVSCWVNGPRTLLCGGFASPQCVFKFAREDE